MNDPAGLHDDRVTRTEFMDVLRVIFSADTSEVNKVAILKRGAFSVNANNVKLFCLFWFCALFKGPFKRFISCGVLARSRLGQRFW